MSDPFGNAEIVRAALPGALAVLAGDPAERHLDSAIAALDMPGNPARDDAHILQGGLIVADLGWACFDAGKWIEAERVVSKVLSNPVGAPPRTQQIVRMAAAGLTNREIGERLYLSPRTVGCHLYRAFPKIGVTSRNQLRDIVDAPHSPTTDAEPHPLPRR